MNRLKMTEQSEDPSSRRAALSDLNDERGRQNTSSSHSNSSAQNSGQNGNGNGNGNVSSILNWLKSGFKGKQDLSLRDTIEEYIEESASNAEETDANSQHEKTLIANILKLRDMPVVEAMIPRADILAFELGALKEDLLSHFIDIQYSRIPVYKDKLDDVLGTIHIKDVLTTLAQGKPLHVKELIRDVPIISPSMTVLDLLIEMRQTRKHMAMVIDEYGGIDGLITIGDIIEEIVGHLEDEHDHDLQPQITPHQDGTLTADARYDLDDFEAQTGAFLTEEEREENDTLGGLVFFLAGRVPARGEIIHHGSGMMFEILEADPRRVNRLKISNIPQHNESAESKTDFSGK
ncbi:MAG: hemolysin family protein [Alphaproteobacteria bacterium]